jgi:hypothetical protein
VEWATYSPDGRQVRIQRDEHRWIVETSGGGQGEARSLADALAQALGRAVDRSLTAEELAAEAEWIRNHAEQVEREFRRMGA